MPMPSPFPIEFPRGAGILPAIGRPTRPSARVRRACALFGLGAAPPLPIPSAPAAARLDDALGPGEIALVTGPSGSGKSTILRALADRLALAGRPAVRAEGALLDRPRTPVVDLFDLPLGPTLRLLARAGLADATLFARTPAELSDGQRSRLILALAMRRAEREGGASVHPVTLIVDEFASTLDRTTAAGVARTLHRWVAPRWHGVPTRVLPPLRLVVASAHDDLLAPLAPRVLVHQPLAGPATVLRRNSR